jgi:DNA-directed RNA polymerase subunit E'/Rpb7
MFKNQTNIKMGKKHRADETEDDRKARKRAKKELKRAKKSRDSMESTDSTINVKTDDVTTTVATLKQHDDAVKKSVDESSPFFHTRLSLVVSLYPAALANVTVHVTESIRSMLLKFSDNIGGVLLAFENVNIVRKEGVILNELPPIHYSVEMDGLVFCPTIGTELQGVVNECFPSHVGLLVHRFFNAMVPAEQLEEAGYIFDRELQQWTHEGTSKILEHDDCVDFTVEKLHECAGIISMEGSRPIVSAV